MEWSGVEWSGVEWSGVEWSGVEWSGVEWSGVEWCGGGRKEGWWWVGGRGVRRDDTAIELCFLEPKMMFQVSVQKHKILLTTVGN